MNIDRSNSDKVNISSRMRRSVVTLILAVFLIVLFLDTAETILGLLVLFALLGVISVPFTKDFFWYNRKMGGWLIFLSLSALVLFFIHLFFYGLPVYF